MSEAELSSDMSASHGSTTEAERRLWLTGSLLVASSIALGAFGAHAVKSRVDEQALGWWETAAAYHRAHGLATLAIAALWPRVSERCQRQLRRVSWGFVLGTFLFSGSLYMMTLTSMRALGAVTPIGGTMWLTAWGLLALSISRDRR